MIIELSIGVDKMKSRVLITTALLTAGLGFSVASSPANAAVWHKGTPTKLRGTWNDSYKVPKGRPYDALYITKHVVCLDERAPYLANAHYKYLKHNIYKFRGYDVEAGHYYTLKVHYFSHKHVRTYDHVHRLDLYK